MNCVDYLGTMISRGFTAVFSPVGGIKINFSWIITLACILSLSLGLIASIIVPIASGGTDPNMVISAQCTPISGVCNSSHVLLSVQGIAVQKPIDAYLVIDTSGSMGTGNPNSLYYAKQAANQFVDAVLADSSNRVGLVNFGTTATHVRALTNDKAALHTAINALTANGYTNIDAGIYTASSRFSTPSCTRNQAIILLTDGIANYYGHTSTTQCTQWPTTDTACTLAAVSTAQAAWPNANIFCVGIFGDLRDEHPECLTLATSTLSRSQNAGYTITYSSSDLPDIFNTIIPKLNVAAKDITITDSVSSSFNIVSGSVVTSPSNVGTLTTSGQDITWSIGQISNQIFTLGFDISCKSGQCGSLPVNSVANIHYQKSNDCTYNDQTFPGLTATCTCLDCTITAPSSLCSGSTGNTASTAATGADTYSWSITNGVITAGANAQTVTFTAGSSGTTTLSVTVTKSSCSKTCTKDIPITAKPDCTITAPSAVCGESTGNTAST
ncbi:MAG: VWA domain-containing protein, partial [Methanotrichaceae archaeon]